MKIAILFEEEAAYQRKKDREMRNGQSTTHSPDRINGEWATDFEFGDDEDVEELGMQPINIEDYR